MQETILDPLHVKRLARRFKSEHTEVARNEMKLSRRHFHHLIAGTAVLPVAAGRAGAQAWPSRPVRWIVGYAPGGGNDIVARLMGQWFSERLGQPFVVENRPGAATNIATESVVNATPDGYTLLLVGQPNAINATALRDAALQFHPRHRAGRRHHDGAERDGGPSVVPGEHRRRVHRLRQGQSRQDQHGVGRQRQRGPPRRRIVPVDDRNQDGPRALSRAGAGDRRPAVGTGAGPVRHLACLDGVCQGRQLKALAVTTAVRAEALPDLPTVGDTVPGYEASAWYGIGAPQKTPAEIIDRLNKETNAGLADARLKARLADLGGTLIPGSPADFGKLIAEETEKWAEVIRTANIKL